ELHRTIAGELSVGAETEGYRGAGYAGNRRNARDRTKRRQGPPASRPPGPADAAGRTFSGPDDMNYITCRHLIDFLMDYVNGELPPAERHEFERHLKVCPPCVAYLDTYRESIRLGKAAAIQADEASIPDDLVKAILASRAAGS